MYRNEPGTTKLKVADYVCHVPPFGYGWNIETGELQETYVIKRSEKPVEQYWEREEILEDYEIKREAEVLQQERDSDYVDPELAAYRQQEWHRRKCGVWFWNYDAKTGSSRPVYITGLHYFYMQWWEIDIGYPSYRARDTRLFYLLMLITLDPFCLGLLWITKRKEGKTAVAGCWVYETITRYYKAHGGIQSMNDEAAFEFYEKAVLTPWVSLPSFFRPVFDTMGGSLPMKGLYFNHSSKKGKGATVKNKERALESKITFGPAKASVYDGPKLKAYVSDECLKLDLLDINVRHQKVRFACEIDGEIKGKMFYTSTVEDDDDTKASIIKNNKNKLGMAARGKKLWDASNPKNKDANGQTKSGLYRYLLPAYETGQCDIYGEADTDKMRTYFENMFASYANDKGLLYSLRRKNPFVEEDLWRVTNDESIFETGLLNDRIDNIAPFKNAVQRGNFVWKDGIEDSTVEWRNAANGRFYICWNFTEHGQSNRVVRNGKYCYPQNDLNFSSGCDPFSHSVTVDYRKSDAVAFIKRSYDPNKLDDPYNDAFVCMYSARPDTTSMFYEDMIRMGIYFGCQILFENNKNGWEDYFIMRGYEAFLAKLPGEKGYGIPGNNPNVDRGINLMYDYHIKNITKFWFSGLMTQMITFDYQNRTAFDKVIAALITMIADSKRTTRTAAPQMEELSSLICTY